MYLGKTLNIVSHEENLKKLWYSMDEILGPQLQAVEELIRECACSDVPIMQELMEHIVAHKGKRMRPILLLLSKSLGDNGSEDKTLVKASAAVELIHMASLIHDDIIDSSMERRGKQTINATWGNRLAVLAGDFLFGRAFEIIALCKNYELNKILTRAIRTMCEGEMEQIKYVFDTTMTEQQYLLNIFRKTAVLMEASCGIGARLATLADDQVARLEAFGRYLGLAFQITDDVLDIIGEPSLTGKQIGNDFKEGVITLPLIYMLQDPACGPYIKEMIDKRDLSVSNLQFIQEFFCSSAILERSLGKAAAYINMAKECLADFSNTYAGKAMENLAEYVLQRQY